MFQTFITLLALTTIYKMLSKKIMNHPKLVAFHAASIQLLRDMDTQVIFTCLFKTVIQAPIVEEIGFRYLLVNFLGLMISSSFYINLIQSFIFGMLHMTTATFIITEVLDWKSEEEDVKIQYAFEHYLKKITHMIQAWLLFNLSQKTNIFESMVVHASLNFTLFVVAYVYAKY